MNQREKVLVGIVGSMAALFVIVLGGRAMFVKPLKDADRKVNDMRGKLKKLNALRREYFAAEDYVKSVTQRTFSHDLDEASATSGELVTHSILEAGLSEVDFSRLPVGPLKYRGAREIGWSIRGIGPLARVVDMIFLLQNTPAFHRLENLTLAKSEQPGSVKVSFRYLTLVVAPAPVVDPIDLSTNLSLSGAERRLYDPLIARDVLRPYVKRLLTPNVPASTNPTTPPPPGPEAFKVVSLSQWAGKSEVHVRDLTRNITLRYAPGDELAGGKIVMVDYRPMPMPDNSGFQSFSRLVLKIGDDYWAVERGHTLADKHKLKTEQLPKELAKL